MDNYVVIQGIKGIIEIEIKELLLDKVFHLQVVKNLLKIVKNYRVLSLYREVEDVYFVKLQVHCLVKVGIKDKVVLSIFPPIYVSLV